MNLRVSVIPSDGVLQPVVYLRSGHCHNAEVACAVPSEPGADAYLPVDGLSPGDHYLWIDSQAGAEGGFDAMLILTAPIEGDSCSLPKSLVFSGGSEGRTAQAFGNTRTMIEDTAGSCGGAEGKDLVFTFTTDAVLDLEATLVPNTPTFQAVMYLRSTSCDGPEVACASAPFVGQDVTLRAAGLSAGAYYLWIDGLAETAGSFILDATLSPPSP
jgi:hypothetical protein